MSDKGVYRTAPATPGLFTSPYIETNIALMFLGL